jgi:hypothetical protein
MSPGADINLAHGVAAWRSMDREQASVPPLAFNVWRSTFGRRLGFGVWGLGFGVSLISGENVQA